MTTTLQKVARVRCVCADMSSAVEIGTLVFALINFLLAVVPTLYTLTALIYVWCSSSPESPWLPIFGSSPERPKDLNFVLSRLFILLCMSLISLTFACYLVIGVIKQKAIHIKMYLIYGTTVHVVSSLAVVGFLFLTSSVNVFVCTGVMLLALYAMVLLMIHNTYKKFKSMDDQFDHKVLDDPPQQRV